ncbi:MAG: RuBisCO large subunit C-terminal-like domain-containing protein [Candidatus Ratteibacteria bacterium]
MERYHLPEIFLNTLDGIDLKTHIIATYYMKDRLQEAQFIDHFELLQSIALEGSTGTWEKVEEDTEQVRKTLSGKLVGYYEIPVEDKFTKEAVVQFAFPIYAWIDNLPMMLLSIAGNCFAYSHHLRLLDIFLPQDILEKFSGPKFGVEGIRKITGVKERPFSLHIIKPKMGMTPEQVANQVYQTALGGVDMVKDDEMTSDVYNNTYLDRLDAVLEKLYQAEKHTGKKVIYFLSITHEPDKIVERAHKAIKYGATGLLITYSAGLPVLRQIASDPEINVPILWHASHMIAAQPRISWPVFAKLARICGADLMLTPTYWSSIPMVSMEEGLRTAHVKLAPLGKIRQTFPMPCAGVYPGLAPILIGEYGPDIVIPAGGGMLGHPDGYTAGAAAWQQAIAAVMEGIHIVEYAKRPENQALRRAIEKWGYIERPKTPWLRIAPQFHPKKMEI